jgi:hypothetical protein
MLRINAVSCGALLRLGLVTAVAGQWWSASAEDTGPSAFAKDRYISLRARSPFAMASVVATPASQASFAANWYVSGVARIGDDYYVTIKSRDLSTQFSLFAGHSVGGVMLASVDWSDHVGKSTVVLRKGTETARLEFNEAQLRAPAAATAAASPAAGGKPVAVNPQPIGVSVAAANNTWTGMNGGVPHRRVLPIPVPR